MAMMGALGGLVSFAGSLASADAQRQQGEADRQAAYYKAGMEERKAMDERAVAQRKAFDEQKQTQYVQSSLQANAAASGAGASDTTVVKLAGDIAQQGTYHSLLSMWQGESRGRDLETQATLDRYVGDQRKAAAERMSTATIIGGVGGLFSSFGKLGASSFG